jgi:chromosome segregation ATPase
MKIDTGDLFGTLNTNRHDRDLKHLTEHKDFKAKELETIKAERAKI